jgi:hypothetical protein
VKRCPGRIGPRSAGPFTVRGSHRSPGGRRRPPPARGRAAARRRVSTAAPSPGGRSPLRPPSAVRPAFLLKGRGEPLPPAGKSPSDGGSSRCIISRSSRTTATFVGRDRWSPSLAHNGTPGPGGKGSRPGPATPVGRMSVRQSPTDPNRLFVDFDTAAPGGQGGASVRLDPTRRLASIDGVHRMAFARPGCRSPRSSKGSTSKGVRRPH